MKLEKVIAELKKNPEFARAYEERALEFEIARAVIHRRLELGWTQQELAEKVGTKQGSISRLENASGHPSFSFIKRVARALGVQLHVSLGEPCAPEIHAQTSLTIAATPMSVEAFWLNIPLRRKVWSTLAEAPVPYGLGGSFAWNVPRSSDLTTDCEYVEAA